MVSKKKAPIFRSRLCVALPGFPGRPSIATGAKRRKCLWRLSLKTCLWHVLARKKPRPYGRGFVFALSGFLGRPTYCPCVKTCLWHVLARKKPRPYGRGFVFALPIFPGSHPPSIVGVHELNFCVRDGNRWTLMTINTNFFGWVFPIFIYVKELRSLTPLF